MLARIAHRGPDDEGLWSEGGVCFGHRRLSIIDLSPAGHQPMQSACGRFVLTMNGEIYNFRELRSALDARSARVWRGHSDTEVLLETIAEFGVEEALAQTSGMYAFALWDRVERKLWLARDRFGEKPLYYVTTGGRLAFASELTALEQVEGLLGGISIEAMGAYFRYGYVPAPLSIFESARKLPPGGLLVWRPGAAPAVTEHWRLAQAVEAGQSERLTDFGDAVEELDQVLRGAVGRQMVSDAPLGAFLSGGLDSSLVTAIMQTQSSTPIRTFTLGFDAPAFNEAEHAAAVARHIATDHTELYVTDADAQAIAPRLGDIYDEPFADSSQIPTFLVSQMARKSVKVCLTGDGGDELFGGYVRYPGVERLWQLMRRTPGKKALAWGLERAPLALIERSLAFLGPTAESYAARGALAPSVRRAAGWLRADSREALFEATMTLWPDAENLLAARPPRVRPCNLPRPAFDNALEPMMWRDAVDYLPGDVLCKVDRAAMANSLETRVPLLDPEVVAFAWRATPEMKVRGNETKRLLRRLLARYVPPELTERPKVGFTVPLHAWLTGGLRRWATDLIESGRLQRQGLLDRARVDAAWRRLDAGDAGMAQPIWSVLMLQAWLAARGR